MSKNKDQRSAKMDEEITAVETTVADAPVSDVIAGNGRC